MIKYFFLLMISAIPAYADLSGGGLVDFYGFGLTTNSAPARNPLDIEIIVSNAVVDPRARTWTLSSGSDSTSCVQGTSPWVDNITQFGGTNLSTGTGVSGTGIPRVTVSNDSRVIDWDGTNAISVKAASTPPVLTDTASVTSERPDNVGTVTMTSISCGTSSTTLLAAGSATMFISIRNPTTSLTTVWIRFDGTAAEAAVPSIDLAPGSEWDGFAFGTSFLPNTQFNCISGGAAASSVAVYYK